MSYLKQRQYSVELHGNEWKDVDHGDFARNENDEFGAFKFLTSDIVNHK